MAQIRTIVPSSAVSEFRPVRQEGGNGFRLMAQAMDTAYKMMEPAAIQEMTEKGDALGRELAKQQIGEPAVYVPSTKGGHDHASHPGQSHGEWLKYSNQSAVRNDPLDPKLVDAMSFVGGMGLTMDVISGGQESNKPGEGKGSTRHNHGQSADVDFYRDGRKLDWNNPEDLPVLQEVVRTAKSRGVTGIGAGDDYMGPGRFHVGFGAPAVWGAGGKSANAPAWLVEAYNGAPQGEVVASSKGGGGPAQYREAIASIESRGTGDYAAIGPSHPELGRPLGRYQIMEANLPAWSKAALGRVVSVDEFLKDGAVQDAIFDHRFGGYVEKYGEKGAAQAWFSGEGGVGKTGRKDSLGTSVGDYGEKFMSALGGDVTASTSGGAAFTPTVLRGADGKLSSRLFGPTSSPILAAHDAAAGAAWQADVFLKSSQDFMGLSEQYAMDPDGFKQATDEYVQAMVDASPDDFKMDVRANLEKEAGRTFLGLIDAKQRNTRERAANSTSALADKWADDLAGAIATGSPEEVAAARAELSSVLSVKERLPGSTWTPEQSANYMSKAEEEGQRRVQKAQDEQKSTFKSGLDTVIKAAKAGLHAADETLLDNPLVQQLLPEQWREAAAFTTLRDQLPTFNTMAPAEQAAALAEMKAQPIAEEWEADLIKAAESAAGENAKAWVDDPIKRAGEVLPDEPPPPLPELDPDNPEAFMAALTARAEYAQKLTDEGYTKREVYLSKEEAKMVGAIFGKDVPPEMKAVAAGAVVGAMGEDAAGFFKQIKTDDPVIPHVGALMARGGDATVAVEAMTGQSLLDQKVVPAPSAKAVASGRAGVEGALKAIPGAVQSMDGIGKTATAIYAARVPANADDETQAKIMEEAWQAALGQSTSLGRVTGGVQEIGGQQVLLPPDVAGEDLNNAVEAAFGYKYAEGFMSSVVNGLAGKQSQGVDEALWTAAAGGVPSLGGEPIDPGLWNSEEIILTPVGGSRYMMSVNRNGVMIDIGVQGQPDDVPFVFDANLLIQASLVP